MPINFCGFLVDFSGRLPSADWAWEGDWLIDENFQGQITDKGVSCI